MSHDELRVEATGETVGEAKWVALRELEQLDPQIDKAAVRFDVLSEGARGLLGVGYAPARVVATVARSAAVPVPLAESDPAARLRELIDRLARGLGVELQARIDEGESELRATLVGPDLGLVIGHHGQTIDAIETLASAIVFRGAPPEQRKHVVVDAAGYRSRREEALHRLADRTAERVLERGDEVRLDPMTPAERKIVHLRLAERPGVETLSEGQEPQRYVVVRSAALGGESDTAPAAGGEDARTGS